MCASRRATSFFALLALVAVPSRSVAGVVVKCVGVDWSLADFADCETGFGFSGRGSVHVGFDEVGNAVYNVTTWARWNHRSNPPPCENLLGPYGTVHLPWNCETPRKQNTCVQHVEGHLGMNRLKSCTSLKAETLKEKHVVVRACEKNDVAATAFTTASCVVAEA